MQSRKSSILTGFIGLALAASVATPALSQVAPAVASRASSYGLIGLSNTGSVRVINTADWSISAPQLTGLMGSFGGGLFDVVMTPDGKTALISNFGDSLVTILDMTNPTAPKIKGSVQLDFFAEDMDITPDGRYALVTDGGFSSKIFVIDILARHGRSYEFDFMVGSNSNPHQPQAQSVSIMADGKTILCANYWNGTVEVFQLNEDASVTHSQSLEIPMVVNPDPPSPPASPRMVRPINIALSPDGIHAAVLGLGGYSDPTENDFGGPTVFLVKRVAVGQVALVGNNGYEMANKQPQSAVFSPDGTKLYVSTSGTVFPDVILASLKGAAGIQTTVESHVRVFHVSGDTVSAGQDIPITPRGTSQLFGVDTIAIDQSGQFLFVTNPTLSGGVPQIDVVSTISNSVVRTFLLPDQDYLDHLGVPQTDKPIPVGVAFTRYPRYMRPGL